MWSKQFKKKHIWEWLLYRLFMVMTGGRFMTYGVGRSGLALPAHGWRSLDPDGFDGAASWSTSWTTRNLEEIHQEMVVTVIWLVGLNGHPSEKWWSSSIGMMSYSQYFWENAKLMATIHHQPVMVIWLHVVTLKSHWKAGRAARNLKKPWCPTMAPWRSWRPWSMVVLM